MKSELIVDVQAKDVSIALLEDSRLVSLQKESRDNAYAVGDIYLAKVKKLMPGLNAAFVNVGYEKDAFLHYLDLGPHYASYKAYVTELLGGDRKRVPALDKMTLLPDIDKDGKITDALTQGQELLVQIVKEPISSKGPRLTTEIHFTGRFMVLIPFSDKISISQKIKSTEEKMRLRYLIQNIKPANFGVIVRTSAEGVRAAELVNELKTLLGCWENAMAKAQRSTPPALIFEEESRVVGMLRDVFSPSFEAIHVNHPETHAQIQNYVSLISPDKRDIVKLYQNPQPIFDAFGITRQIKSSFGKTVSFRSGAYIIIESTEACHVVDVNSGNRTKASNDQETNALEVNLRAADEIARQLRLRDMGGIIVVDFIDMSKGEHRQQLYEHMREIMANDRARHNILPLSKFGLMQITRQRVRPALTITTEETCPSCFGKGVVQPSLLFTDTLAEKLEYVVNTLELRDFIMYVHPFVDAYIKRGIFSSLYGRWRRKFGRVFKVLPDESLAYLQYRVIDKDHNEIDLKEEKDMNASTADKVNNKTRKRTQDPATEGLSDLEIAEGVTDTVERSQNSDTDITPDGDQTSAPAKKRRRRKKKSGVTDGDTSADSAVPDVSDDMQAVVEDKSEITSPSAEDDTTDAPKPKRRRRAKPKQKQEDAASDATAQTDIAPAEIKLLPPPPSTENIES
ncbi:MAG: Rne/Rng family ribonuclease [Muribaculaceae bacterium]|nr:Rne/Rng family ribonuclease [Muribaculaceae bacterium]